MSRHRYVRNMNYDEERDLSDDDDSFARSFSSGEMSPSVAAQYMYDCQTRPPQQTLGDVLSLNLADGAGKNDNARADAPSREQILREEHLLDTATEQVRTILGDAFTKAQVDAALRRSDYDVEIAIAELLDGYGEMPGLRTKAMHSDQVSHDLEVGPNGPGPSLDVGRELSSFAQLLQEDVRASYLNIPPGFEPSADSAGADDAPMMFQFDQPSPDDIVLAGRGVASPWESSQLNSLRDRTQPESPSIPVDERSTLADVTGQKSAPLKVELPRPKSRRSVTVIESTKKADPGRKTGDSAPAREQGNASEWDSGQAPKVAPPPKQRNKQVDVRALQGSRANEMGSQIALVVTGHVDAGKSTLLGHFLRLIGTVSTRRHKEEQLAWINDVDPEERQRGVTIDIAMHHAKVPAPGATDTPAVQLVLIDSPGHRDFVPTMIIGASQADAAILVVDASPGEFEAGFGNDGQTREHALLIKALGIAHVIVAVNKLDVVQYDQKRFVEVSEILAAFLKQSGIRSNVRFIPVSGAEGLNLTEQPPPSHHLASWYSASGPTLLDAVVELAQAKAKEQEQASLLEMPTRFSVADVTRRQNLGDTAVTGKLISGSIMAGDKLQIMPMGELANVKSVQTGDLKMEVACAGDNAVTLALNFVQNGVDASLLVSGAVLCDPENPVPMLSRFEAQIIILSHVSAPILPGHKCILHVGAMEEAGAIVKLVELVHGKKDHKSADNSAKARPRFLSKSQSAIIHFETVRPVPLETYTTLRALGRFLLRDHGRTIAAGIVTKFL
ncbi:HBS1-like protein [Porphyridium purpureum]|uniref:HBS1-like protein n=1 Tax=Porphyridium purpureum TaxID=35688 RepID=A0A5J4YWC2_PORPP|nr:HBS1-like protein [Porphyridium purpureum]|eukprot:POR8223..scf227_4